MSYIFNGGRVRKALIPAAAATALVVGIAMSGPVSAEVVAPTWQTTFRDDFTGSGLPNSDDWLLTLGTSYIGGPDGFGTGEIETMTNNPSNVDVRNGNLYITPQRDASGQWTSARVETTRSNFKPAAGGIMHVESRLQMPNVTGADAKGYWPAFWMLGSPYRNDRWSWPGIGEFDIMENVQGLNWTYNVLHCGTWGGPCNEPEGINNGKPGNAGEPCLGTTCQAGFHTYAVEWDRTGSSDQLRWYLDGALTFTVNESQVPAATWASMADHAGYFVILNVAIGGAFPNKLDGNGGPFATTKPGVPMVVDYVEVKYAGGQGESTTPTTPSATTTPPATTPVTTTPPSGTSTPASPTTTPPTGGAPTNLRKTGGTASTITMSWDGAPGATYDILRGEGGDKIASVTGNSFTDQGLFAGTPYVYSVRSAGGKTNQVTMTIGSAATTTPTSTPVTTPTTSAPPATTSGTPPTTGAPTNLRKTGQTASTITLGWDGAPGATYDILRGEGGVRIATVTGNKFTDIGLLGNTQYIYSVRSGSATTPQLTVTIS